MYRRGPKRALDLLLATLAILLLSPLLVVVAIVIKLGDPGPIIFRQVRVGVNGRGFALYKFRSMPVATGDVPSDALGQVRIGPVGRLIRRTNIDELPQLFNILRGEMSVVGPRPSLPGQTELVEARRANGALACRPGLTGLAQINSYDGMTVAAKARFDGDYAARVSFAGDFLIIVRTFLYLLKPPPTY